MSSQNVTLAELDEQQSALYRWQYYQYGVVTFWITDADFDPVDKVTDIRYLSGHILHFHATLISIQTPSPLVPGLSQEKVSVLVRRGRPT